MYANVDKCVKHIYACNWPRISGNKRFTMVQKVQHFTQEASARKTDRISFSIFAFFCVDTEDTMRNGFDGKVKEYQLFLGFADKCRETK